MKTKSKSKPKRHDAGDALEAMHDRHRELMRVYRRSRSSRDSPSHGGGDDGGVIALDLAVLQRHFQFLRDDDADAQRGATDWAVRLSVRYYRRLFREYALADLSRCTLDRGGPIGLRWRTELEVIAGKGQFVCGNKVCSTTQGLHSYELLFAYVEEAVKKRCLVKVRVCERCARLLFAKKLREEEERENKKRTKRRKNESEEEEEQKRGWERRSKHRRRRRESSEETEGEEKEERASSSSIHTLCARLNAEDTSAFRAAGATVAAATQAKGNGDDHTFCGLIV